MDGRRIKLIQIISCPYEPDHGSPVENVAIKLSSHHLIDSYDRQLNYLRISITDRCNLRCIYCNPKIESQKLHHDEILRYEEILRIVRVGVAMGITKVRVTGGEPLVRKGCYNFLSQLARIKGLEDLALTTNGVLLKSHIDRITDAGVRRLNISLDTLDRKKFEYITGKDAFDQVWQGIMEAHQKGIYPIKLNVVILAGINDEELADFARLSIEYPFHIRFIEYMPIGKSVNFEQPPLSFPEIKSRIEKAGKLIPVQKGLNDGPASRFRFKNAQGEIGFISPITKHFCAACNRLRLTADGQILSCLLSNVNEDIKAPIRAGFLDENIAEVFLKAVLRKPFQHAEKLSYHSQPKKMVSIGG
jgi:GTP 3',8-cyclase